MECEVVLEDERLRRLPAHLNAKGRSLVRQIAHQWGAEAKPRTPLDTGFLRNSIYVVASDESNYREAEAEAKASNPLAEMLGEMNRPDNDLEALVVVGAEYGAAVEYGHHLPSGEFVAEQPYLAPAGEAVRPLWEKGLEELFDE